MAHKVVIGPVRLSYCHLWEPKKFENSPEKYTVSLIIPKSEEKTIKKIQEAIALVKQDAVEKHGKGFVTSKGFRFPLKDGDEEMPEDSAYADSYYLNVSSNDQPKMIDGRKKEITDKKEIYSGCYANVSLNAYFYKRDSSKGITFAINGLQKVADGEPLDGRTLNVEEDFDYLDNIDDIDEDDFLS